MILYRNSGKPTVQKVQALWFLFARVKQYQLKKKFGRCEQPQLALELCCKQNIQVHTFVSIFLSDKSRFKAHVKMRMNFS